MSLPLRLVLSVAITFGLSQNAVAAWYTGAIESVSARGADGLRELYIRIIPTGQTTVPNPASCAGHFAGAVWMTPAGDADAKLAAAVALTAKASGATVSVEISSTVCQAGAPVITWITLQ